MRGNSTLHQFVNISVSQETFDVSHRDNVTVYVLQPLEPWSYILMMFGVFLMVLSMFMNGLVLTAFSSKDVKSMKSAFLIRSILVADIIVSLVLGTRVLPYILIAFGCDPVMSFVCFEGVTYDIAMLSIVIQLYISLVIVVDRLVSVVKPLTYHTHDYTAVQKTIILGSLWIGPVIVYVIFKALEMLMQLPKTFSQNCLWITELYTNRLYSGPVFTILIYTGIFTTPCLYFVLLCIIVRQRQHRRSMTELAMKLQRSNASLALTLLLVHATYLLCNIPSVIQNSVSREDPVRGQLPSYDITSNALAAAIYQCNTIIDPVIFTWRIRSVRNYMKSLFFGNSRRHGTQDHRRTQ